MARKTLALMIWVLALSLLFSFVWAEELKRPVPAKTPAGGAVKRPNFSFIFGNITRVDLSDPNKPRLEVKSDPDGSARALELTPWTTITKVTDISELKAGDTVRIMARKVDANEVAMTVVFGKIKNRSIPGQARPKTQNAAAAAAPAKAAGK